MQTLRDAQILARSVLVWFALALGVAVASPLVKPQAMELVCSTGGGMKLVVLGEEGATPAHGHTLDCPLCLHVLAPASGLAEAEPPTLLPSQHLGLGPSAVTPHASAAAPLPPRGPPSRS